MLLISGLVFSSLSAYAELPAFEVCLDPFPPRQIVIDGKEPKGQNIEIIEAIGKQVGFLPSYTVNTPFKRCLLKMESGDTDFMVGLVKNDDRSRYMAFIPYMQETTKRFFSLKKRQITITKNEDLKGLKVALIEGFAFNKQVTPLLNHADYVYVESLDKAFYLLTSGRVDLVFASEYIAPEFPTAPITQLQLIYSDYALKFDNYASIAISKKSEAMMHIPAIKNAVEKLNHEGVIETIIKTGSLQKHSVQH
ncbi:substrate-binding periplasmic protein [Alteromonas sediminis]|uniref:substrate-binding periplasmic protein n=1 Tax=Alteromonas sediminis TaxID=2259342 RepID=UPI00140516E7|nr:transporter substrate-binding domain-containing protein [Alteromonas sediminis]